MSLGNWGNGSSAGLFSVRNNQDLNIGSKISIEQNIKIEFIDDLKNFFSSVYYVVIFSILFFTILPLIIIYIIHRIGLKKTIKLFKKINKKHKCNKRYVIHQVDEFTPAQKIATFDTKNEAEKELEKIENESTKIDEFTCFYISEEGKEIK